MSLQVLSWCTNLHLSCIYCLQTLNSREVLEKSFFLKDMIFVRSSMSGITNQDYSTKNAIILNKKSQRRNENVVLVSGISRLLYSRGWPTPTLSLSMLVLMVEWSVPVLLLVHISLRTFNLIFFSCFLVNDRFCILYLLFQKNVPSFSIFFQKRSVTIWKYRSNWFFF